MTATEEQVAIERFAKLLHTRERALALVREIAKQNGREEPTGDDARQALEELTQIRGEVAAIAGDLDKRVPR